MTILLLHSGGTIAMAQTSAGLAPQAGIVEAAIKAALPEGQDLRTVVFDPLLDSADVGPAEWNRFLDLIDSHPDMPVILTHGTDTMAYTGAALSQALAGHSRRVILCGSMVPLGFGGDAEGNLAQAIRAALDPTLTGVMLAFAGKLLAADGLVKHDSHAHDAFRTVAQQIPHPPTRRRFETRRLAVLTLSPGVPAAMVEAALNELDGAVLRIFGAGTMMSDPALIDVLSRAVGAGKRLRAVSQCETGGLVIGAYAAGAAIWTCGVENGGAETPEAALIRLWLTD
jgi:L-asparaginase